MHKHQVVRIAKTSTHDLFFCLACDEMYTINHQTGKLRLLGTMLEISEMFKEQKARAHSD
jgi:hypothetical protein